MCASVHVCVHVGRHTERVAHGCLGLSPLVAEVLTRVLDASGLRLGALKGPHGLA